MLTDKIKEIITEDNLGVDEKRLGNAFLGGLIMTCMPFKWGIVSYVAGSYALNILKGYYKKR